MKKVKRFQNRDVCAEFLKHLRSSLHFAKFLKIIITALGNPVLIQV